MTSTNTHHELEIGNPNIEIDLHAIQHLSIQKHYHNFLQTLKHPTLHLGGWELKRKIIMQNNYRKPFNIRIWIATYHHKIQAVIEHPANDQILS